LQGHVVVQDPLVNQVRDHFGGCHAYQADVALVAALELQQHALYYQLTDFGQFGVYYGNKCGVYVREVGGGHLGFYYGAGEQALPPQDVLVQQLDYHVLDVRDVHFVDYAVYRFTQQLPHQLLVLDAGRVLLH
jgi:hypothetical protein